MKKVAIIGAGRMTRPIANYLMDTCNYQIIMVDQIVSRAKEIIGERPRGKTVSILIKKSEDLDPVIDEADIAISMVPKPIHIHVAKSCLRHRKNMLTASYETPEVMALAPEAKEKGILFLNEMGENPGIDHFGTQMVLETIKQEGGEVTDVESYGCGIPSFEHNNNPMGYKFSWDPRTFFVSAQTTAAYYKKGKRVEVPGDQLFKHFWLKEIDGVGTFETYPNKDCKKYLDLFALAKDVSFFRGLLRFPGYCNKMRYLKEIGLFHSDRIENFENVTYRQLTASLVGGEANDKLEEQVAEFLNLDINADFIHCLKWLDFFNSCPINIKNGTVLDVLLDRMLEKMSYAPHEKDMVIVHIEVIAEFPDKRREKRLATMKMEGIPYGDSAMSRAVGLPIAIGARMILEGKINAAGAHIPPTLPDLYRPILNELATFGLAFKKKTIKL